MTSLVRASLAIAIACASLMTASALAQRAAVFESPRETRAAMEAALAQSSAAAERAERLEAEAARATEEAEKLARRSAALAARIQQSEADMAAGEARVALIERQRAVLQSRLARKQRPLVRLIAGLQNLSRRPLVLAVLQPGSLRELVHMRAILAATLPAVEQRTAALRGEIARSRALQREARRAVAALGESESELEQQRARLAAMETRQRLASRQANDTAAREAQRALALAEDARDLDSLIGQLDAAAGLREQLAALPGPILRPSRPAQSQVVTPPAASPSSAARPPSGYQLPVAGRALRGFGALAPSGVRSEGITLAPRAGAIVVAPASGRIAFAGPYRGYGRIVIVEHPGGWTSLVTDLARVDAQVGDRVVGGAPLGVAGPVRPTVTLELRRGSEPVNPLDFLG